MKICIDCKSIINPQSNRRCQKCWFAFAKGKNHPAYGKHWKGLRLDKNPSWKGGKSFAPNGYVLIRIDGKYVYEHRYVMERFIQRRLKKNEVVHHINHIKTDNRIENLKLLKNQSDHIKAHIKFHGCLIKGCREEHDSKQLCSYHYNHFKNSKCIQDICRHTSKNNAVPTRGRCSLSGCEKPHFGRGFCQKHHKRWWRAKGIMDKK